MADRIDRACLWLLTALSALIFFLVITDGQLFFSVPAAFTVVAALRLTIRLIPEKPYIRRREQLSRVHCLLRSWALMDESQAIDQIKRLLPDLYTQTVWPSVHLIQRLPDSSPLSANELIILKHRFQKSEALHLLCTCPVSSEAADLLPDLTCPCIHLTDSRELSRLLMKKTHILPSASEKTKKRRKPLSVCAAQFVRSVRPLRSGMYMAVFFSVYLITKNRFYLLSALLFLLQLSAYCVSRFLAERRPA